MQSGLKILKFLVVTIAVLFMALVLLSYVFEDKIKTLTVQALNKSLKSEIKVGTISFSVVRNFPYASVVFNDITCKGSNTEMFDGQKLFNAKKVTLLFSLINLFSSSYSIKKIIVADGSLNLLNDKNGLNNYDIFKSNESAGTVSFEIEKAEIENIHFYQRLEDKKFEQEIHFNKLTASGNFSDDVFSASLNTNAYVHFINANNQNWLTERSVELDGVVAVDQKINKVSFNDATAKVEQLTLNGKGEVITSDDAVKMNLGFSSKKTGAKKFLSVVRRGM